MLLPILGLCLYLLALETLRARVFTKRWQNRGIETRDSSRVRNIFYILIVLFYGTIFYNYYDDYFAGLAFLGMAWLFSIVITSDLKSRKIPSGACWLIFYINLSLIIIQTIIEGNTASLGSALVCLISVSLTSGLLAIFSKGKFGSGDMRLLIAISLLSFWSGYVSVLVGIIFGSIIQVPMRALLRNKYSDEGIPFAPALIIGTLIGILLLGSPGSPCNEFGPIFSC